MWNHIEGHKSHAGPLPKHLQNMKNGIGCAVLCYRDDETTDAFYTALLGCSSGLLQKLKKHSDEVLSTPGATFTMGAETSHTHEFLDCALAKQWCVWEFLHSYYGSRLESYSTQLHNVLDPSGVLCRHPHRSYHEVGKDALYDRFLESPHYEEFCSKYPGKNICGRSFDALLCKCASDPRLKDNQYALDMKALPCACSVCQENAIIAEQEILTGEKFQGPRRQCPFYDDIASTVLPAEGKVRYGMEGICTILRNVPVADDDLYGYINPFYSRDKYGKPVMDSKRTNQQLTMQLRNRGKSVGTNKDSKIRTLIEYLVKKNILREADVVQPPTGTNDGQAPAEA